MPSSSHRTVMLGTGVALLLSACSSTPYPTAEVHRQQLASEVQRKPMRTWTSTEPLLECVGDRMRESRVLPPLVSWGVADTSGKTGVDQGLVLRSALHKIARRGSGMRVTSMGVPPLSADGRGGVHLSPEERLRASKGSAEFELAAPDWVVEGGISSVVGSAAYRQRSGGVSGRDIDAGYSNSRGVDVASATYTLKRFRDGVDITGASVDLKIFYQQGSTSLDLGGYVAYRQDGKSRGFGVRIGSSSGFTESPEEAVRIAVETAMAMLFADQYGIDLAKCPAQSPPLKPDALQAGQSIAHNQVAAYFEKLDEAERLRWLQASLAARNYDPGPADGKMGPKTRSAIAALERDSGLPPGGGRVDLPLLAAVAQWRIARGEDIRKPPQPVSTPEPVRIGLSVPYGAYVVGQRLRAQVVAPQAGHMVCLYNSPDDGTISLHPLIEGRLTYVGARTPLQLPSATEGRGQPSVTFDRPGRHALYCALSRTDIAARLPATLHPGADGRKVALADAQATLRRVAGDAFLAEGLITFDVAAAKP